MIVSKQIIGDVAENEPEHPDVETDVADDDEQFEDLDKVAKYHKFVYLIMINFSILTYIWVLLYLVL